MPGGVGRAPCRGVAGPRTGDLAGRPVHRHRPPPHDRGLRDSRATLPVELRRADARPVVASEPAVGPHVARARAGSPEAQREEEEEEEEIEEALRGSGGNRAEAARPLGIGRVTLWKRMRRLGMNPDDVAGLDVTADGGDGESRER